MSDGGNPQEFIEILVDEQIRETLYQTFAKVAAGEYLPGERKLLNSLGGGHDLVEKVLPPTRGVAFRSSRSLRRAPVEPVDGSGLASRVLLPQLGEDFVRRLKRHGAAANVLSALVQLFGPGLL